MGHRRMLGRGAGNTPSGGLLTLEFDDIANAPVADPNDVADWNALFSGGTPYTSVAVIGNIVELMGGTEINVLQSSFGDSASTNLTWLIRVVDTDTVTNLSQNAFRRQINLVEVVLNEVNETTSSNWFTFCSGLQSLSMDKQTVIPSFMCASCSSLTSVSMNQAASMSGSNQFESCSSLVSASLPALTNIANTAFNNCTSLIGVYADLVETIGSNAFNLTPVLEHCSYPICTSIGNQSFRVSPANSTLKIVNLPLCESVEGSFAFIRRTGLVEINLASCTSLGGSTGNNNVFLQVTGNTITCTLPLSTRTDGDAVYLDTNNTVTFLP